MKYVFVDNYRGFTGTLIPLKDVNFLVGENSTGKTSILCLLKLLTANEFWLQNELDLRKVGLSTFRDIVGAGSNNKSSFSVGLIYDAEISEEDAHKKNRSSENLNIRLKSLGAQFMTFTEKDGMPKLTYLSCYRNGYEVRIKYIGDYFRYKYIKKEYDCSAEQFIDKYFSSWLSENESDNIGYVNYKGIQGMNTFIRNAPPIFHISIIESQVISDKKNSQPKGLKLPSFIDDITWLAPIRSKPRKTYDEYRLDFSPEGDHTPYLIKKKLNSASESEKFKYFLEEVGEKSGLFKSIEIKNYGRGATTPFELDVVLSKEPLNVSSVGYGVSQALPVIVEMFSQSKNSWIAIQQPEVHLHPKAQAALGEAIFNLAINDNKIFFIETHSDYMIDRFRISNRKSEKKSNSQILFFERTLKGNKITPISIGYDGEFSDEQPAGYREFFIKEEMDLLGL